MQCNHRRSRTSDKRVAVELLELMETAAVNDAGDDLADVECLALVLRNDSANFCSREERLLRCSDINLYICIQISCHLAWWEMRTLGFFL